MAAATSATWTVIGAMLSDLTEPGTALLLLLGLTGIAAVRPNT